MTDGLKRYYSQKWCQGFCGRCGTSCADYCEDAKTMKANLECMTAERDEAVRDFKDIEADYNDCIKSSADELDRLREAMEVAKREFKSIADTDYRGNRSQESIKAFHALEEIERICGKE